MPSATSAPPLEVAPTATNFDALLGPWANSADPAYCRDIAGRLLAVNQAFARKFGRAAGEWPGLPLATILHADDQSSPASVPAELARPPHRTAREHRCDTPQGWRWIAWEKTPLHDAAGVLVGIRAVGRDITKQRVAEEQYLKLSRAVEQSPVAIVITDADGRVQYVNPKYTEASGRTLEDILDGNIDVLRDGHPDEASYRAMLATVRTHHEWHGELNGRRSDGRTVCESVQVSSLRGPGGEVANLLCLREDVTERKHLEQELRQAQKMESLGTLAGGIAHDFNNLLAIINGYSELCLNHTTDPARIRKALQEIHRAAQRASGLVRQILTFRRQAIGVARILLEKKFHLPLGSIIEEAVRLYRVELAEDTKSALLEFFEGRIEVLLQAKGYEPDILDMVLATGELDIIDVLKRAEVIAAFRDELDFNSIYPALNRVLRILPDTPPTEVNPNLLQDVAEIELAAAIAKAEPKLQNAVDKHAYAQLLTHLGYLQPAIDRFFDEVLVMSENAELRFNRLALLNSIAIKLNVVGDLTKLAISGN